MQLHEHFRLLGLVAVIWVGAAGQVASGAALPETFVGPQSCPNSPETFGYVSTTTLTGDMFALAVAVANGTMDREEAEREFTLCPQSVFDLGSNLEEGGRQFLSPLVPFLENTHIRCGDDGKVENNCTISGGYHQVVFDDDFHWLDNITFSGITFEKNEAISVMALGHPVTDMKFMNCEWKNNVLGDFLVVSFWDEDMDVFLEPQQPNNRRRMLTVLTESEMQSPEKYLTRQSVPGALHEPIPEDRRHLQETGKQAMQTEFEGCNFVDNNVMAVGILNQGGSLELDGCTFERNRAAALVASIQNSTLSLHGSSSFYRNEDTFGPVFVDSSSVVLRHEETEGDSNVGLGGCQGLFLEKEGHDCIDSFVCDGDCCEFGDVTDCGTAGDESVSSVTEGEDDGLAESGSSGCGTGCAAVVVVMVVIPTVVLVLCIVIAIRAPRQKQVGIDGTKSREEMEMEGSELEAKSGAVLA